VSEALAVRAEILKLARLLRRDPETLDYLEQVSPDDIRKLREQVTDMLFAASDGALRKLAASSRLLPIGIAATIGERAFGPVVSARIAGLLDPGRAVEMAAKLSPAFLADVAIELDPRRASDVIARMPPQQLAAVTKELVRRKEYVTMGRFVGHMRDEGISAALSVMDEATLLRVGFVLEQKSELDRLVGLLPQTRLDRMIDAAVQQDLWAEVLDLLGHLSEQRRADLVSRADEWDDEALDSVIHAAQEGLWPELLSIAQLLPLPAQQRIADALGAVK
jgi:hypothetical protein